MIITTIYKEVLTETTEITYLLEAYYMFLNKGVTFEINNVQVTGTYENSNEQ